MPPSRMPSMYCGVARRLQVLDDAMHFGVGHERAVHALRIAGARRHVQHVALPEQRLRAHLVEDRARVDLARDLERDARRDVRLDEAGDDVDRRALRGEHEVDARGARLLRDARDQLLDLLARSPSSGRRARRRRRRSSASPRAAPANPASAMHGLSSGLPDLLRLGDLRVVAARGCARRAALISL